MTVIIDASVAVKWVVEEEGSQLAARLVAQEPLAAPDFLILECANALHVKARRRELDPAEAKAALAGIQATPIQLFRTGDYAVAAQELAFNLGQTVYDCLYLALAIAERAVLVTADRSFVQGVVRDGVHANSVQLLGSG